MNIYFRNLDFLFRSNNNPLDFFLKISTQFDKIFTKHKLFYKIIFPHKFVGIGLKMNEERKINEEAKNVFEASLEIHKELLNILDNDPWNEIEFSIGIHTVNKILINI